MQTIKILPLLAVLGLAACSGPSHLRGGGGGQGYLDPADYGSVDDPTSVAYFQEALGDRVHFVVDRSDLSIEARMILDRQADWLIANREYRVLIEGHTDEQGTRQYNLALGARRASAVQQYLIARGVEPERLRTITYGKERPIEICSVESCYSRNRRAVSVLTAGPNA